MVRHTAVRAGNTGATGWKVAAFLALALSAIAPQSLGSGWVPAAQAADTQGVPVARDARLAGDETRTRFIVDLSKPVEFAVRTLSDPYRIVVDLPELRFDLEPAATREGVGLISDWRHGLFAAGKSRIVLDAAAPVAVDKAFVLPPVSEQPARLVLDVVKTTRAAFLETAAEQARAAAAPSQRGAKGDLRTATGNGRPVIVLDPGHGGIDTGAVGSGGTVEKAVVLDFSSLLHRKLVETGRYTVHMTREEDIFIPLRERVEIARGHQADLLVSIHADSVRIGRKQVRGAGVYTLSEKASDAVAAALAERENRSDVIAGIDLADEADDVTDILVDLARMETKKFSFLFARTLVDELRGSAQLVKNPHRSAGFRVLTAHDVPSALVELGYLSNRLDEKLMTTDEWRERMSDAIIVAIDRYFARRTGSSAAMLSQTAEAPKETLAPSAAPGQ